MSKSIVIGNIISEVIKNISSMYMSLSIYLLIGFFAYLLIPSTILAGPQSSSYEIKSYDFGSGGVSGDTSTSYSLFGNTGQVDGSSITSTNYKTLPGLTYTLQANVPGAPTLSIPANNYDRIKVVLDTGGNPSDTVFAIEVSTTSDFSSNNFFVQSDDTLGVSQIFQDNTTWGASGFFVTQLNQNTTYYIKVKARQGNFTESDWGPSSSQQTGTSTLSFSLDSNSITFSNLNAGNSYTDNSKSTVLTTSTNAYFGYTVYGWNTTALRTNDGNTIASYASPNSAPTSWSGTGFGYTTNDNNLQAGTGGVNRFNNGAYYAGFGTIGPGDPVADDPGPSLNTQISNESFTISYRITGDNTTKAGTYSNTILYSIAPSY